MTSVRPSYGLYPYQHQVLDELLDVLVPQRNSWVQGDRRVIAHMPTGAGKTRTACHAACHLLNRFDSAGKVVIWLASTDELCQQAIEDLTQAWESLGNRPVNLYQLWGDHRFDFNHMEDGILVAGLPKLRAVARSYHPAIQQLAESAALVIFDEAHQVVAPTYRSMTEDLISHQAPLLGLTATPGRTAQIGDEDYELAQLFNSKKVTINPRGHSNAVVYLTTQGFLAEPEFIRVAVNSELTVQNPADGADYSSGDLESVGNDAAWQQAIEHTTAEALRDHQRVMVFCPSVQSAKTCEATLIQRGHIANAVVSTTNQSLRQQIVERYRGDGDQPMAILNYGVFTAGFDAPRTRCVVIARPTTSLVLYSQMVGRAMRGPQSGGNRSSQIYTMSNSNLPSFASVGDAFMNWEGLWQQN